MGKNQRGTFIVEFAIIAAVMFVILFAAMELFRMIWIWNTIDEATRRGARLAAVCEIDHLAVPRATVFTTSGSVSPVLRGLKTDHVSVRYFMSDGATPTKTFEDVRYVNVSINCTDCTPPPAELYSVTPIIPFVTGSFTLPTFETTLPSESLGYIPGTTPPDFGCL